MVESERPTGASGARILAESSFRTLRAYELMEDRLARVETYSTWSERSTRYLITPRWLPRFLRLLLWSLVSRRVCDREVPVLKEKFRRAQGVDVRQHGSLILLAAMATPSNGVEALKGWAELNWKRIEHHTDIAKAVNDG